MKQAHERIGKFKRIEPHLYKREYQTSNEDWSVRYYARFTCRLKKKRRIFPLGSDLLTARDQLKVLEGQNVGKKDFDEEKAERERAQIEDLTLGEWLDRYLDLMKHIPSWKTKRAQCAHLKRLLGSLPLQGVTKVRIMEYKNRRLSESLIRHGKPVKGTSIMGSTVNREVSCLIAALNLAAEEGLCEAAPRIKKERETPRERTLKDAEYKALLGASPRWFQRVFIAANEAALDKESLLKLTWDAEQDGLIVIQNRCGSDKMMPWR